MNFLEQNDFLKKVKTRNNLFLVIIFFVFQACSYTTEPTDEYIQKNNEVYHYVYYPTGEVYSIGKVENSQYTDNVKYYEYVDSIMYYTKDGSLFKKQILNNSELCLTECIYVGKHLEEAYKKNYDSLHPLWSKSPLHSDLYLK